MLQHHAGEINEYFALGKADKHVIIIGALHLLSCIAALLFFFLWVSEVATLNQNNGNLYECSLKVFDFSK